MIVIARKYSSSRVLSVSLAYLRVTSRLVCPRRCCKHSSLIPAFRSSLQRCGEGSGSCIPLWKDLQLQCIFQTFVGLLHSPGDFYPARRRRTPFLNLWL